MPANLKRGSVVEVTNKVGALLEKEVCVNDIKILLRLSVVTASSNLGTGPSAQ